MVHSSSPGGEGTPASTAADSPRSENSSQPFAEHSSKEMKKKRKMLHEQTTQVRLVPGGAGGDEFPDDGYSRRKYGRKISSDPNTQGHLTAAYYNLNTQNCPAPKRVQRSDEDPLLFSITYRGIHTCLQRPHKVSASASEEQQHKHEHKKVKAEVFDSRKLKSKLDRQWLHGKKCRRRSFPCSPLMMTA